MNEALARRADQADIALLLEGTYPYVSGGVASWVSGLLKAFSQYTFAIVFIGGRAADYGAPRYELPDNVVHFEEVFLFDYDGEVPVADPGPCAEADLSRLKDLHADFRHKAGSLGQGLADILPLVIPGGPVSEQLFLHGQQSWDWIGQDYQNYCTDPSFTDYFWTVRIMHIPLWKLFRIAQALIPVRLCHAVSTGYAGFLGALLRFHKGVPLLIAEHGIYTKERQIDLYQSHWIRDNRGYLERDVARVAYFQDLWMRFFRTLGSMAYEAAGTITALYEGNRRRQVMDGAIESRTCLVPNGIHIDHYQPARDQRPAEVPMVALMIGRVVPIKDIKTFIRSIFVGRRRQPGLQGWIVGPEDEDPDYVQECRDLIVSLGQEFHIRLLGFRDIREVLPQAGVVVLSSISEGLPLVVLEAYAAGLPVVATDVGACRELVEGRDAEDADLGASGRIVRIADPAALSRAILELLTDPEAWRQAQQAGMARVQRYYTHERMVATYEAIYQRLSRTPADDMQGGTWPA